MDRIQVKHKISGRIVDMTKSLYEEYKKSGNFGRFFEDIVEEMTEIVTDTIIEAVEEGSEMIQESIEEIHEEAQEFIEEKEKEIVETIKTVKKSKLKSNKK